MGKGCLLPALISVAFAQGCSIYPLPEDYSGATGVEITNLTRCQIGDGVKERIISLLESKKFKNQLAYETKTGGQFAAWLKEEPERFRTMNWTSLKGDVRYAMNFYKNTAVSIDYSLEGSENNKIGVDGSLLRLLRKGSNTFGFSVSNDRTRTMKSQWRSFDTFASLMLRPKTDCEKAPKVANLLYPSAGLTKVATIVERFTALNEEQNAASKENVGLASLSDTITYTTKTGGNFKPTFKLPGSTNDLIATEIAPSIDMSRQDTHVITVLVQQTDGLPKVRFDAGGRITDLTAAQARRLDAEAGLDRVQARNAEDSLRQISQGILRLSE